ncbi:MAG: hypothetical protein C0504_05670 [Candidatus Solibacter sp.]|nr:hypothetical protein [Candidatus Solibacter sp.]
MRRDLFIIACSLVASAALAQPLPPRKGVSVQMATSTNSVAVPDADQPDSLIVAVTRSGSVYLEVTNVTAEELGTKLGAELAAKTGRRVYLKGDARAALSTMAEVLNALRAAGVVAPVILTNQEAPVGPGGYLHPYGQEVWLGEPQGAPTSKSVRIGPAGVADEQLKARAQREKLIVLQIEGVAEWGGVVRAADICRGAGAKVYLSSTVKQK